MLMTTKLRLDLGKRAAAVAAVAAGGWILCGGRVASHGASASAPGASALAYGGSSWASAPPWLGRRLGADSD